MNNAREIPSGFDCAGCGFLNADTDSSVDLFNCLLYFDVGGEGRDRLSECIADYPYGGTITVEAKEKP